MFKKKQPQPETKPEALKQSNGAKFRTFAYYLAWVAWLSAIGSAVFSAIKDKEPPDKDEFYK